VKTPETSPLTFAAMTTAEFTEAVARAVGAFVGAREVSVTGDRVQAEMLDGARYRIRVEREV
jgi:hypothetical protein